MFETFETYITAHGNFSPEDLRLIRSRATVKKSVKRNSSSRKVKSAGTKYLLPKAY